MLYTKYFFQCITILIHCLKGKGQENKIIKEIKYYIFNIARCTETFNTFFGEWPNV